MASTRKRGQNHRGGESGSSKTRKTSRADPDKLVELRFLFSSDDEEEGQGPAGAEGAGGEGRGSRAAPIREGRWRRSDRSKNLSRSNNTLTGVFTQRTVNLMEHLNRRLYWVRNRRLNS